MVRKIKENPCCQHILMIIIIIKIWSLCCIVSECYLGIKNEEVICFSMIEEASHVVSIVHFFLISQPHIITRRNKTKKGPKIKIKLCFLAILAPGSCLAAFQWTSTHWQAKHSTRPSGLVQTMSRYMCWSHIAVGESMSSRVTRLTLYQVSLWLVKSSRAWLRLVPDLPLP